MRCAAKHHPGLHRNVCFHSVCRNDPWSSWQILQRQHSPTKSSTDSLFCIPAHKPSSVPYNLVSSFILCRGVSDPTALWQGRIWVQSTVLMLLLCQPRNHSNSSVLNLLKHLNVLLQERVPDNVLDAASPVLWTVDSLADSLCMWTISEPNLILDWLYSLTLPRVSRISDHCLSKLWNPLLNSFL